MNPSFPVKTRSWRIKLFFMASRLSMNNSHMLYCPCMYESMHQGVWKFKREVKFWLVKWWIKVGYYFNFLTRFTVLVACGVLCMNMRWMFLIFTWKLVQPTLLLFTPFITVISCNLFFQCRHFLSENSNEKCQNILNIFIF